MPVVPITNAVLVALASLTLDNVDCGVVKSITTLAFLKIDNALLVIKLVELISVTSLIFFPILGCALCSKPPINI